MKEKVLIRDSNMELARIVAMAMILIGHFIFHGILGTVIPSPNATPRLETTDILILSFSVFCTAGVDLFMLISGFYGIKLRWRSLISLWLLCAFYNFVNFIVNTPLTKVGLTGVLNCFVISRTPNWFFQAYFWVMMASPILNKAVKEYDIKTLRVIAILGLGMICISSWRFANPKGNTPLLLIVLYILGGYIRREDFFMRVTKTYALSSFFVLWAVGVILGVAVFDIFHKEYGIFFQHNSLLVIAMAVSLFLFFRKCEIRSKFINTWASTVVAALFIQDVILFQLLYGYVNKLYIEEGLSTHLLLMIAVLTTAIFVFALIVELPRKFVSGIIADHASSKLNRIISLDSLYENNGDR